jgi:diguanylate cyclase (GGDEF)-like protein
MGLLLLAYGCWQAFDWPPGHRALIGGLFFFPFDAAVIWAIWRASTRCSASPRLRSAWRLLACAAVADLCGDIGSTIYEASGMNPYPSVVDLMYLSFYPLMMWGLLRFSVGERSLSDRLRLGLDLAVVAIGSSVVVLYLVLEPTITQGGSSVPELAVSVAYPVGDMVILVGLASVMLRQAAPSARRALQFAAVGLLLFVVADVVYDYMALHSSYQSGDAVDALYLVALSFFAVGAAAQETAAPPQKVPRESARRRASWLPYFATAIGFGLLIFVERHDPFFPNLSLAAVAVLLAALVSARQFLAQRDLLHTQGELSYLSLHDGLTGLPNRVLVYDRAEQLLARARRQQASGAVLYVDIDGFKRVNDTLGHAAGDDLLKVVSARLAASIREGDTVGRLGGDEFAVLVEHPVAEASPELVAERLLEVVRQPIDLNIENGRTILITASIGIAYGRQASAEEMLSDADLALYEAKAAGKDCFRVFESRMQAAAQGRRELQLDLRHALSARQFFLLYQPIFDLQANEMTGVEALIRWRHPTRGTVAPDRFIPIAEESGLIVPIGRWVLDVACEQAAAWHKRGHPLGVSVNVSARQLEHDSLVASVQAALDSSGLDPGALTLEITETALMRDSAAAALRLRSLKALGVRIAIDDFGTGYSSLAYLREFPIDALKIDRSFISGIASSHESSDALIHTLVQLGKSLGLQTLGEGIEDRAQLEHLQREQCELGQGFLFARPLEAASVEEFFTDAEPTPVTEPVPPAPAPRV